MALVPCAVWPVCACGLLAALVVARFPAVVLLTVFRPAVVVPVVRLPLAVCAAGFLPAEFFPLGVAVGWPTLGRCGSPSIVITGEFSSSAALGRAWAARLNVVATSVAKQYRAMGLMVMVFWVVAQVPGA